MYRDFIIQGKSGEGYCLFRLWMQGYETSIFRASA